MKRFQFSLNTVLSYKQQVLEELRRGQIDVIIGTEEAYDVMNGGSARVKR